MSVFEKLGVRPPDALVENKLFRDVQRAVTLLVEAGFDQRFWRMHVQCSVRHMGQGGRAAALKQLDQAHAHPDAMLLAVLDADLDRAEGRLQERPDVIWTDAHDLETTLLGTPVLEKLLHQRGPEDLAVCEGRWKESFRARLFRHALHMGRLRWLKQRRRLEELRFVKDGRGRQKGEFERFPRYDRCVDKDWSPSPQRTIKAVIDWNNAQNLLQPIQPTDLEGLPAADPEQVCNGHDLVGFLQAWLKDVAKRGESVDELADALALACESAWLLQTRMAADLRTWERRHEGFVVLREPSQPTQGAPPPP